MRSNYGSQGDNEYGMVIGSVKKGGSAGSDQFSGLGYLNKQGSAERSTNLSTISENTKLVNLQVLIDREIIMDSIN